MSRRGFTLAEVLVSMCIAVAFLVCLTGLELTSIRRLDALSQRQEATLVLQDTVNKVLADSAQAGPPQAKSFHASRGGRDYAVKIEVESQTNIYAQFAYEVDFTISWEGNHTMKRKTLVTPCGSK